MFNKQIVVVTGGTRGIGRGITEAFLEQGATVIATYKSNDSKANELYKLLNNKNLILKKFDVSIEEEVKLFFDWIDSTYEKIDILINNSGIRKDNIVASMSLSDFEDVININLKGCFLMSKSAVLLMMKKRFGRIVNMSSVGGKLGLSGQGNYAASKAAMVAFSKSLSKEVGRRGITVNNVLPGFIETELIADLDQDLVKEYKKQVPLKRFGTTKEVAAIVLFLCSKDASYITGASIDVSGGL